MSQKKEETEGEVIGYLGEVSRRKIEINSELESKRIRIKTLEEELAKIRTILNEKSEEKKDLQRDIDILTAEMNTLKDEHKRLTNILYKLIPGSEGTKVSTSDNEYDYNSDKSFKELEENIRRKLRKCIHSDQFDEKYIQDGLSGLLSVLEYLFNRENVGVPHATKMRKPDFTVESLNLAIEVKLLQKKERLGQIIEEIGADIQAYKKKYNRILFVIYDCGFIQNVDQFIREFEDNTISVIVVKH